MAGWIMFGGSLAGRGAVRESDSSRHPKDQGCGAERRGIMHPAIPRRLGVAFALAAVLVVAGVPALAAVDNAYTVHPLVADVSGEAQTTDANLVNAWGLVAGPTTPWWVVDNETGKSTVYNASLGAPALLTVNVAGGPTGA